MSNAETWTVRRILDWTIDYLKQNGSESPRLDAEVLLAHARGCQRIQLYTQYNEPLTEQQRSVMRGLVKRRATAEPVAYLVGHREFFSLDFIVNAHVLIPRPDTEILVINALDACKGIEAPQIVDLCTGSGCVAIALAKNHLKAKITAVDISPEACEVASQNIKKHQVEERVRLLTGDMFSPLPKNVRFDLIVSNPPYIPNAEVSELQADVQKHEPHLALAGGEDGLDFVRKLINDSPIHLNSGGWLMFEISPEQAMVCSELLKAAGYVDVSIKNDLSGQARVVCGKVKP